ncbi:hypothetical protein GCM10010353_31230 [Streptomyces chryseus]|nr:hypothetical protein GCM10010353_31230 [Streptomyces chryseus]
MSRLFSGEIEHQDSLGSHAFVRPGELNLMTGGYGISHSEVSSSRTTVLHGVQLWVALRGEHRRTGRDFKHCVPRPVRVDGVEIRVFLGTLAGDTSPVLTFTPLLGAELLLGPRAAVTLRWTPASSTASSSTRGRSARPERPCRAPSWATSAQGTTR